MIYLKLRNRCFFVFLIFLILFLFSPSIYTGIPGLHKWVIHNFPSCVKIVHKNYLFDFEKYRENKIRNIKKKANIFRADNLLFDLNQLLHKANVKFKNLETYFSKLFILIKNVLNKFCPLKNVIFAIDGVCPFSKLKLQIKRRAKIKYHNQISHQISHQIFHDEFSHDKFSHDDVCQEKVDFKTCSFLKSEEKCKDIKEEKNEKKKQKEKNKRNHYIINDTKNQRKETDEINDITCGSNFVKHISTYLINYVKYLSSLEKYRDIKFYVSTDEEIGEGELKLMNWVNRYVNLDSDYNKNKENGNIKENKKERSKSRSKESFVIVGADADLLLQCLALENISNIYIYTYQQFFMNVCENEDKKENLFLQNNQQTTKYNWGKNYSQIKKKKKKIKVLYNLNIFINLLMDKYQDIFESVKKDLLVLFLLKGNDYLPKIKEGNFSIFFQAYFNMIEKEREKERESEIEREREREKEKEKEKDDKKNKEMVNKILENDSRKKYDGFFSKKFIMNTKYFLKFLNEVEKLIKFSVISLRYNYNDIMSSNKKEKLYSKKNVNASSPLSFLNELISRGVIPEESFHIKISKHNDLYKCTLNYIKNETMLYCNALSKKKKMAMHKAAYTYLQKEYPKLMECVTFDVCNNKDESEEDKKNKTSNEKKVKEIKKEIKKETNDEKTFSSYQDEENRMKIQLIEIYENNCKNKKNCEQEKKIVDNYLEGLYWLVEMYTTTCCIDFNFFYKYVNSPSLLSLYYYLSKMGDNNEISVSKNLKNMLKKINLSIFKNNKEYYECINYCVAKYKDSKWNVLSNDGNKETNEDADEKSKKEKNVLEQKKGINEKRNNGNSVIKEKYEKTTFFDTIYSILFSKNICIVKENIQNLNRILQVNFHRKKIQHYYWRLYAQRLKNFYKIIVHRKIKIYVSNFALFKINWHTLKDCFTTVQKSALNTELKKKDAANLEHNTLNEHTMKRYNRVYYHGKSCYDNDYRFYIQKLESNSFIKRRVRFVFR